MEQDHDAIAPAESRWRMLYRIGGISAGLFVAMLLAATVLAITTPPPPTSGGAATLEYIASHRILYIVHQQLWLVPGVFAAVIFLALYPALKPLRASVAALGCAVGGIAWAPICARSLAAGGHEPLDGRRTADETSAFGRTISHERSAAGYRELFGRLLRWRVRPRWYA